MYHLVFSCAYGLELLQQTLNHAKHVFVNVELFGGTNEVDSLQKMVQDFIGVNSIARDSQF